MKGQPHRLDAAIAGPLSGAAIERDRPLQFRLDGRTIVGFVGDTVLSAVLAAGIDTVGKAGDGALALSARFAPAIVPAARGQQVMRSLAMARTPATDGADYISVTNASRRPGTGRLARLLRPERTLGLLLDQVNAVPTPWRTMPGSAGPSADLIVVGGGVAGMTAALAGAKAGQRVILLESSPRLGGNCRLFGTTDGEETPDEAIARMASAIAQSDAISVMVLSEAFALRRGMVRAHVTEMVDGVPSASVVDLGANSIVLATGTVERLPIFAGNRRPGTQGTLAAFDLAYHYGVWPGKTCAFATTGSATYRLAMLARDAGIETPRIFDSRPRPQSRFIEFSRAYGITQTTGTIIAAAGAGEHAPGLEITSQLAVGGPTQADATLQAERLVVCGGWQPDLTLWHMAGGASRWLVDDARLEGVGTLEGIALAGSAAGYISRQACLASGEDAVAMLLEQPRVAVDEQLIDPMYETPDAPCAIALASGPGAAPAYLDAGHRLNQRMIAQSSGWLSSLFGTSRSPASPPAPLDVADVAASVQLGEIPAISAGIVARERVAMISLGHDDRMIGTRSSPDTAPLVPGYLACRFGRDQQVWRVEADDGRAFEVGTLLQADADHSDPLGAIGVVLRSDGVVLIATNVAKPGQPLVAQENGRSTALRLVSLYTV